MNLACSGDLEVIWILIIIIIIIIIIIFIQLQLGWNPVAEVYNTYTTKV
jgi:hypothetical protein